MPGQTVIPKIFTASATLVAALCLVDCARSPGITNYLTSTAVSADEQVLKGPISAGLIFAVPETELSKPTALSRTSQDMLAERMQKKVHDSGSLDVTVILPPIILPGDGQRALPLDRLRELAKQSHLQKLLVVVPTSQVAQRVQPYPIIETQLFAKMDLALVDLVTGAILLSETGAEDYLLGRRRDVEKTISYPRIYYRTQTTSGPFLVVEGDPFVELGKVAFEAAADQLVMRLLERLRTL